MKNNKISNKKVINFLIETIPFIIECIFLQLTDFVDTTLSSRVNQGTIVGISTMVLVIAIIRTFSNVMAQTNEIITSKIFGKNKKDDQVNVITYNCLVLSSIINIALCFVVYITAEYIIKFMGLEVNTLAFAAAKSYLTITLIGCLLTAPLQQILQSKLKIINKSKKVMQAKIIYTILNIIGDTLAVKLGYGAFGIAVSTVICQVIEVVILLIYSKGIAIRKIEKQSIIEIMSIYKVNILSRLGHRVGVLIFTSIASNLGENLYANYVIAQQLMYLGVSVSEALGESSLIQIGHLIGEGNNEKVEEGKNITIKASYVLVIIVIIVLELFGKPLISLISNNTYDIVALYLIHLFVIEVSLGIMQGPYESYLLAKKEVKYVTRVNLEGVIIVRILSAILFVKLNFSIYGIALALIIDYISRYTRYKHKVEKESR